MTQPKKIESLTLDSHPSIAVAKAALAVCEGSSIPSELYDRLGMVSDAINHLERLMTLELGIHRCRNLCDLTLIH